MQAQLNINCPDLSSAHILDSIILEDLSARFNFPSRLLGVPFLLQTSSEL
jgi:hypothetical protein